jgi:hypothetical protein
LTHWPQISASCLLGTKPGTTGRILVGTRIAVNPKEGILEVVAAEERQRYRGLELRRDSQKGVLFQMANAIPGFSIYMKQGYDDRDVWNSASRCTMCLRHAT